MNISELEKKSVAYRKRIIEYIYGAKAGHTGGSLSCIDILNVLYNDVLHVTPDSFDAPNRDRYIQSKGHCVEALYAVLADKGFFPSSDLDNLCSYKSHYIGHPTRKIHGVEQNTGALGHGLPISAGIALSGKMDNRSYRVFTLLGDGELSEGSNWEAALTAAHYNLDNLCAIIDSNKLQISGTTAEVCNTEPIDAKFESFGWAVRHVNGNDVGALQAIFRSLPFEKEKPSLIIAHTTKGKGISFMENQLKWHHGVPSETEYVQAMNELSLLEKSL
ncbi:transketolase [Sphingobacterium suaedae]|uniref:Transketolase n=1 Tax=Sphingobacterium suaedae TaxID=1686402 RepID=A0ABW5KJ92_9SPHI